MKVSIILSNEKIHLTKSEKSNINKHTEKNGPFL